MNDQWVRDINQPDSCANARNRAKRLGVVCFATLTDALDIHPWAVVDGSIVGHLWTLDEKCFAQVDADQCFEGTLEEALLEPWADEAQRAPFHDAMNQVLVQVSGELEAARTRQRRQDLDDSLPPAADAPPRPAPFRDRRF